MKFKLVTVTDGDKAHTVLKAILECGRNFGLAATLLAFGGVAFYQPSISGDPDSFKTLGWLLLGGGMVWTLLATWQFVRSLDSAMAGHRYAWLVSLIGALLVLASAYGVWITAARWADNNAAIRFCRESPEASGYAECKRIIPHPKKHSSK